MLDRGCLLLFGGKEVGCWGPKNHFVFFLPIFSYVCKCPWLVHCMISMVVLSREEQEETILSRMKSKYNHLLSKIMYSQKSKDKWDVS